MIFLPALQKEAPKLLQAGKLAQRLQEMVQKAIQSNVQDMKIGDLGISESLDRVMAEDEKNALVYQNQKNVIESIKGLTFGEFSQVMQWFGTSANKHAELAAKDIPIEECFKTLASVKSPLQPDVDGKIA